MLEKELSISLTACFEAMKAIMEVYATSFEVITKEDDSPVTKADFASNEIILARLREAFPDDGFLSEESQDDPIRFSKERVWIIDPLDGTKDFVAKNGEFAVNIALAINKEAVLGIVGAPVSRKVYYAIKGEGAFLLEEGKTTRIHVSSRKKGELIPYCSKNNRNKDVLSFVSSHPEIFACECIPLGASLKMAYIAEGKADYFLRLYPGTKEWDVASADIILTEAGGVMLNGEDFKPFLYNREDVRNLKGYVIANSMENTFLELVKE